MACTSFLPDIQKEMNLLNPMEPVSYMISLNQQKLTANSGTLKINKNKNDIYQPEYINIACNREIYKETVIRYFQVV